MHKFAINFNSHINTSSIQQLRGLRQGGPLNPLLFNTAFDSFLRLMADDPNFKGFQFSEEVPAHFHPFDCLDDLTQAFEHLCVIHRPPTTVRDLTSQLAALFPFYKDDTLFPV
ncbi:unnamed protein product [Rhizopus stolonifer]